MTETDAPAAPATGPAPAPGPEPIFLLSPPRSHSTVAIALLSGHPEIHGFPELLLFPLARVGELLTEGERKPHLDPVYVDSRKTGPCRALAQLHDGDQSPAAVARAEAWLRERADWPVKRLMDHLLELVAPRIGLEKSPDTVSSDAALAACLAAYPRARFVHLIRHPVTTQRSMHRHWQGLSHMQDPKKLVVGAASSWYLGHSRVVRALDALPADQWMRVRSEDLLGAPRIWLPKLLGWLGLDAGEQTVARMLDTRQWVYAGRGESGDLYGGDPIFMNFPALRPVPDPGPVRFDPAWGLPAEMCRRMTVLARSLGY